MLTQAGMLRRATILVVCLSFSACKNDDQSSDQSTAAPPIAISITSLGDASVVETADPSINLYGTASSGESITSVSWKNDRGGNGAASGTDNWATGRINLQVGRNKVTLTAKNTAGSITNKVVSIDREARRFDEPEKVQEAVVLYSYSSDLKNPAPVAGATIDAGVVHLYLVPKINWINRGIDRIDYICCQASGQSDDSDLPKTTSDDEPWRATVDLSDLGAGSARELEIAVTLARSSSVSERQTFGFTVTPESRTSNDAPNISGAPSKAASAGMEYSFLPITTDSDGDSMGFTIENKPDWAQFDVLTGRLHGIPQNSDLGRFADIRISASDGRTSTELPPFAITVDGFATGATNLRWSVPTERMDNSRLTNLAGFDIHYGPTSGDYGNRIVVENPTISRYVIDNLAPGKWKFVVVAYDENGISSRPSNTVFRTVQ